MPKKIPKMTIEQHVSLGRKIKLLAKLQEEIYNEVAMGYGKSSRAAQAARSCARVGTLTSEMDEIVCRETDVDTWQNEGYSWLYRGGDIDELRESRGLGKI